MWNELTFLWNELTILWNDLTMERNDRIPDRQGANIASRYKEMYGLELFLR